jgi:hypothetical protein
MKHIALLAALSGAAWAQIRPRNPAQVADGK